MNKKPDYKENVMLLYNESKLRFESSVKSSAILDNKSFWLAGFYITALTTLSSLYINGKISNDYVSMMTGFFLSILWIAIAIKTKKFPSNGCSANSLISTGYLDKENSFVLRKMAIMYDEKTTKNNEICSDRGSALNTSIFITLFGIVLSIVVTLI